MQYSDQDFPHQQITKEIISASYYIANGYKMRGLFLKDNKK